jgi:hypothetical protein
MQSRRSVMLRITPRGDNRHHQFVVRNRPSRRPTQATVIVGDFRLLAHAPGRVERGKDRKDRQGWQPEISTFCRLPRRSCSNFHARQAPTADCGLDYWVVPECRVKLDEFFPSVNYLTPLARLPELFCRAWADRPSMWEISDESRRWTIFQFGPCGQSRLPFGSFHVSRSSRLARSPGYSIACCGCARERRSSPDVSRHTENQPALQLWRGDEAARTGC